MLCGQPVRGSIDLLHRATLTTSNAVPEQSMSLEIPQKSPGRPAGAGVIAHVCAPVLSAYLSTVAVWIVRRAERRALRELAKNRRLLSHVGLTREQVVSEFAKPCWRR
jgi:uncharacterized protein YjiS (DUF1127 family)